MRIGSKGRSSSTGLALLAASSECGGSLIPGCSGFIPVVFTAPVAVGQVHFQLTAFHADSTPFDWSQWEVLLRPSETDDDWGQYWSTLTAQVGTTWSDVLGKVLTLLQTDEYPSYIVSLWTPQDLRKVFRIILFQSNRFLSADVRLDIMLFTVFQYPLVQFLYSVIYWPRNGIMRTL